MDVIAELRGRIGAAQVETDGAAIEAHRHDQWVMSILRAIEGRAPRPACVARPRSTADVAAILEIADASRTPVVPYGAGSGGGIL